MSALVASELLKIRSTRTWWAMLVGVAVVSLAFTALLAALVGAEVPGQPPTPGPDDPAMARTTYLTGFQWGYLFALVLGVLGMAGEVRHQTITPTFLATPHRGRVVLAKMVAVVLFSVLFAVGALVVSTAVAALIFMVRGYEVDLLGNGVPRALGLAVLATAIWGLVGLGLGTMIRNQVAAILVGIGAAVLIDPIISFVLNNVSWGGEVARFLPSQASNAIIQASSGGVAMDMLSWWAGALVLLGYGAVFAGIGTALTLQRDIT